MPERILDLGLLEGMEDRRRGKRDAVIFSPVGDLKQLSDFARHIAELGIKDEFDFIFIYRKGLGYPEHGLSALHATEKMPMGTSGCFFAGSALAHQLGYKVLVIADLDSFIDSGRTVREIVRTAWEKKVAVVPLSKSPLEPHPQPGYAVINQWGAVPREVLESAGLETPYMYKGGEDYEFMARLNHARKLEIYAGGFATHPKEGRSAYSKMAERRKYYPYIAGLLKAFAFCARYEPAANLRYVAWRAYYSFFSDALCDPQLISVLERPDERARLDGLDATRPPLVSVRKLPFSHASENAGARKALSEAIGLALLLGRRRAEIAGEEVTLVGPRAALAFGIARAFFLLPVRIFQSVWGLRSLGRRLARVAFPAFPESAERAASDYRSLL